MRPADTSLVPTLPAGLQVETTSPAALLPHVSGGSLPPVQLSCKYGLSTDPSPSLCDTSSRASATVQDHRR